ncbi:MAG: hypothetical protein U5M23_07405 [Marinagarivorans sp.]|nr:hypothetical protein [Marinagarivorans sp.]
MVLLASFSCPAGYAPLVALLIFHSSPKYLQMRPGFATLPFSQPKGAPQRKSFMFAWACSIWPFLLGGLLGWLACGWLARGLRRNDLQSVVASKDARLSLMSKELDDWRTKPPVEVERVVEKIVEKPVDRVVEKVVEKEVDNPSHLASIARLTAEVAVVAGLRNRIAELENAHRPRSLKKWLKSPWTVWLKKVVEKT